MPSRAADDLLNKRWDLLAEYKDQRRRERKKLGLEEALRIVDSLRMQARLFNPGWPTREDREADLQAHLRVATALARTAPREAKRGPKRLRRKARGLSSIGGRDLVAFAKLAEREGVRWYIFRAQAVAAYGVPRTTDDVDVTIDLAERSLETLVAPLRRAGFAPKLTNELFALETRIYPVTHQPTGWAFDLVLAGPGLEQRFLDEVHWFPVGGYQIPVIAPEHLVALKILASRPKDLEDVRGLLRIAELDHARVEGTLADFESILDQSDLLPVYARLRAEARPTLPRNATSPAKRRR